MKKTLMTKNQMRAHLQNAEQYEPENKKGNVAPKRSKASKKYTIDFSLFVKQEYAG